MRIDIRRKAHSQRVVMTLQVRQRPFERVHIEWFFDREQERLVIVMGIGKLLFEKPVLDRCQGRTSLNENLFGLWQFGRYGSHCREFGDGLILKKKLRT